LNFSAPSEGDSGESKGNSDGHRVTREETQNSCKTEEPEGVVTLGYPENGMNAEWKHSRGGDSQNRVTPGNGVTLGVTPETESTAKNAGRRLTEEEAHEVQKLIGEGMEASFARAAVLGEEVPV